MTNSTPDIARIAAGLSEVQRRWLRDAWYGRNGWQINYRKKACDLGLCHPSSSRLTSLGLHLRDYLQEQAR